MGSRDWTWVFQALRQVLLPTELYLAGLNRCTFATNQLPPPLTFKIHYFCITGEVHFNTLNSFLKIFSRNIEHDTKVSFDKFSKNMSVCISFICLNSEMVPSEVQSLWIREAEPGPRILTFAFLDGEIREKQGRRLSVYLCLHHLWLTVMITHKPCLFFGKHFVWF